MTTSLQGKKRNISIVNISGDSFTVLSEGDNPRWHPNEDVILYDRLSGESNQLFELNLDTRQSTQITTGESYCTQGAYSPDGKYITFISNIDGDYPHIFVMKSNGQGITQITSGASSESQPFWGTRRLYLFSLYGWG